MTLSIFAFTTSNFVKRMTVMISARPKVPTIAGMREDAPPDEVRAFPKE